MVLFVEGFGFNINIFEMNVFNFVVVFLIVFIFGWDIFIFMLDICWEKIFGSFCSVDDCFK